MWREFWSACLFCSNGEWMCETVTVCERSAPVICAFSSCPLEHLALIYPSLSNNTAGGFKGRRPKSLCVWVCCTVSKQLYFAPFFNFLHSLFHISTFYFVTVPLGPCWAALAVLSLIFFPFAHSHPQCNWLLASSDSQFRRCLSKTAAHSHTDMWVLCFRNSTHCKSTPPSTWLFLKQPLIVWSD